MQSNEFITEDTEERLRIAIRNWPVTDDDRQKLFNHVVSIKKECQPFLNTVNDPFDMLRGMKPPPTLDLIVEKEVRLDDRKPMSTPRWLHDDLNIDFKNMFGEPFRDAMFVTGDVHQAKIYGMIHCIFPVGNFKYLWSPEIQDLFEVYDEFRAENKDPDLAFIDTINLYSYTTKNLNKGLYSGHEIMVRTDRYYALNLNDIKAHGARGGVLLNAIQEYFIA